MVKLIEVEEEELEEIKKEHRGKISYPILKMFIESGFYIAKVDRTGLSQSMQGLVMSLRSYSKNHKMPIRIRQHGGDLFLQRTDMDEDGNLIEQSEEDEIKPIEISKIDPARKVKEMSK